MINNYIKKKNINYFNTDGNKIKINLKMDSLLEFSDNDEYLFIISENTLYKIEIKTHDIIYKIQIS